MRGLVDLIHCTITMTSTSTPPSNCTVRPLQFNESYLSEIDGVIFDCDGVLWHEDTLIGGAAETIAKLHSHNKKILFCSNNSSKSRAEYINKINELQLCPRDMNVDESIFYCSSYAAAHYLTTQTKFNKASDIVLTIGGSGIANELKLHNVPYIETRLLLGDSHIQKQKLIDLKLDSNIRAVIAGIDDKFTYSKCCYASTALLQHGDNHDTQTLFISTNQDRTLPTAGNLLPGGGSVIAMISTASSRIPINVGKPESYMLDLIVQQHQLNKSRILMVGDRLDTDILFGNHGGIRTLLVSKTGVSSESDMGKQNIYPTYITDSVASIFK